MDQWENEGEAQARERPGRDLQAELDQLRDQEAARDAATQALIAERDMWKAHARRATIAAEQLADCMESALVLLRQLR